MTDSEQNGDDSLKPKEQVTATAIMENSNTPASNEIHKHGQNLSKINELVQNMS